MFLPPVQALNGLLLFHHLLLGAGIWFALRERGGPVAAGTAGTLSITVPILTLFWVPDILMSFAWFPWVLFFVRSMARGRSGAWIGYSAAFAFMLCSGYPSMAYLAFLFSILEALMSQWPLVSTRRFSSGLAAGSTLALALNASWLLPLAEIVPISSILHRPLRWESLPFHYLFTLADPFRAGNPLAINGAETPFLFSTLYLGLPVIFWWAWGFIQDRTAKVEAALLAMTLVLALGETSPLVPLLKEWLPGYRWVFRSGYVLPWAAWYGVRLGWEGLSRDLQSPRGGRIRVGIGCVLLVGAFASRGDPEPSRRLGTILGLACLGAYFLLKPITRPGLRWTVGFLAMTASLWPVARSISPFTDARILSEPPASWATISPGERIVLHSDASRTLSGLSSRSVVEDVLINKEFLRFNWANAFGGNILNGYSTFFLTGADSWVQLAQEAPPEPRMATMSLLRVDRFIGGPGGPGFDERPGTGSPAQTWDRRIPSPLFRCFPLIVPVPENPGPNAPPLLPPDPLTAADVAGWTGPTQLPLRPILSTAWGTNRMSAVLGGSGPALVASSDAMAPGWRVRVDDRPARPLLVDGVFRGVEIGAQANRVDWTYEPASIRFGFFISLVAAALLLNLALGVYPLRK